jgi:hypothetical protein
MAGITEDELKALVDNELRNSLGYYGGKLAEQRRKAEYYYLGIPKGDLSPPDVEGRSSVVSTDVRNIIEWMIPTLMTKFVSGDNVVEFEPTKDGDEEKAQSATDYINYLFFKKNNGFSITEMAFRDALLQKKGIIKVWWDTSNEEKREEYKALSDVELAQILEDDEVEPIEHNQYPDEEDIEQRQEAINQIAQQLQQAQVAAQQGNARALQESIQLQAKIDQISQIPPKMLHDVAVKRVNKEGKLVLENIPPEEFLLCRDAKNIEDARFVAHRVLRTKSYLKSMGYKNVDNLSGDDSTNSFNAERVERMSIDNEFGFINQDSNTADESQRQIWVIEAYVRADRDGDGISELIKVTKAGNEILEEEVVDCAPFVDFDCIKIPHKAFGLSVADMAMESQKIKTNILRASLDDLYLRVNGRYFAVENQVNLDDLLTSRPGGVVRIKQAGAVGRLDQAGGDAQSAQVMMEYMQSDLENRTGWTRYSQGTDADSLNDTATGVLTVTNRADMRIDLIARHFADGFVRLFRMMLKLVLQNQNKEAIIRLNGNYVQIDPREWRNGFDTNINVGLGTGDKTQQAQKIMQLMGIQREALAIGVANPQNVYEAAHEFAKTLGYKNGNKFFSDPSKAPPQQKQPDPLVQVEQMKQQGKAQEMQATMQLEREKTQLEMQQSQFSAQVEAEKKNMENETHAQLELLKSQHQMELEQMRIQATNDLEWRKAQLQAETQILVAQLNNQAKVDAAADKAANAAVSNQWGE